MTNRPKKNNIVIAFHYNKQCHFLDVHCRILQYFARHQSKTAGNAGCWGKCNNSFPFANGFYQSKGVSSNLPGAYLYLSKKFLQDVCRYRQDHAITLREWQRGVVNKPNGWSYHAKGIWLSARDKNDANNWKPFITVIGSSNYTRRAYSLDLESNALIITRDEELRKKWKQS